jgi:WD40 repeat protein
MKRTVYAILFSLSLAAQPLYANVAVTMYTSGNGIQDMVFSGEYIFCATSGGVVQWDTRTMTYKKYTMADGLPDNSISSIAKSPDGKIWCSSGKGIAIFDVTSWKKYSEFTTAAQDIEFTPDGAFYASISNGVMRLKGVPGLF